MIPAHRPSWIFGDIYTPQDVPESLQFGWRLTTCYGGTPMILTLGKYNKHNNMNYIENIQGIPPFADRFSYGVTIRSPTSHWFSAIEKPPCHSGKKNDRLGAHLVQAYHLPWATNLKQFFHKSPPWPEILCCRHHGLAARENSCGGILRHIPTNAMLSCRALLKDRKTTIYLFRRPSCRFISLGVAWRGHP